MRRLRTQEEIEASQYISQAEIRRMWGYGASATKRIYSAAEAIDREELGVNRPVDTRVRLRSVYKVLGIKPTKKRTASGK